MGEAQHVGLPVAQAFQEVAGLGLFPACSGRMLCQADQDGVAPRAQQRICDIRRDFGSTAIAGVVSGGVEREQRVQGLLWPVLAGVGFVGGDEFAGDARCV